MLKKWKKNKNLLKKNFKKYLFELKILFIILKKFQFSF